MYRSSSHISKFHLYPGPVSPTPRVGDLHGSNLLYRQDQTSATTRITVCFAEVCSVCVHTRTTVWCVVWLNSKARTCMQVLLWSHLFNARSAETTPGASRRETSRRETSRRGTSRRQRGISCFDGFLLVRKFAAYRLGGSGRGGYS